MGNGILLQTFFVVSGFFAARLLRTQGLKALLWDWWRYLLLPVLLTAATLFPISSWMFQRAVKTIQQEHEGDKPICTPDTTMNIWCAAKSGELEMVKKHLAAETDKVNTPDPLHGMTPLTWAVIAGNIDVATYLLRAGAEVNGRNSNGGTALHAVVVAGREDTAELLLLNGIDTTITDHEGKTALSRATTKWRHTFQKAGEWQLEHDPRDVYGGRLATAHLLLQYKNAPTHTDISAAGVREYQHSQLWRFLTNKHMLLNLWFLWHLCLMLPFFALYAFLTSRWRGLPPILVRSPLRFLWLIPLTMLPMWYMSAQGTVPGFCSDVYSTILPPLRVLLYYGIFLFFGTLYYDCHDFKGEIGKRWVVLLLVGTLLVFPLALIGGVLRFAIPNLGIGAIISDWQHLASVAAQATYSWVMVFAVIGCFRRFVTKVGRVWHYICNSSYWLYLANTPILILVQDMMKTWRLPADIKYIAQMLIVGGVMLLTYEYLVRRTLIGKLLGEQHRSCSTAIAGEVRALNDEQQPV